MVFTDLECSKKLFQSWQKESQFSTSEGRNKSSAKHTTRRKTCEEIMLKYPEVRAERKLYMTLHYPSNWPRTAQSAVEFSHWIQLPSCYLLGRWQTLSLCCPCEKPPRVLNSVLDSSVLEKQIKGLNTHTTHCMKYLRILGLTGTQKGHLISQLASGHDCL